MKKNKTTYYETCKDLSTKLVLKASLAYSMGCDIGKDIYYYTCFRDLTSTLATQLSLETFKPSLKTVESAVSEIITFRKHIYNGV